jgi:hypothetical protein
MSDKYEVTPEGVKPCKPAPTNDDNGGGDDGMECHGSIQGTIRLECDGCGGCEKLKTETNIISVPPQTEGNFANFLQTTVSNYENDGYLILAHSVVDVGGGWLVGLTIGWYE